MSIIENAFAEGYDACFAELGLSKQAGVFFRGVNAAKDLLGAGVTKLRSLGAGAEAASSLAVKNQASNLNRYQGYLGRDRGLANQAMSANDKSFALGKVQAGQDSLKALRGRGAAPVNAGTPAGKPIVLGSQGAANASTELAVIPKKNGAASGATGNPNAPGYGDRAGAWWKARSQNEQRAMIGGGGVLGGLGLHSALSGGNQQPQRRRYYEE